MFANIKLKIYDTNNRKTFHSHKLVFFAAEMATSAVRTTAKSDTRMFSVVGW